MRLVVLLVTFATAACSAGTPDPQPLQTRRQAGAEGAAAVEWCNGLDDNRDGFADERYECVQGREEACVTPCGSWGIRSCSLACTWADCAPGGEVCNGQDDDCDGDVDEDFGCVRGEVTLCDAPNGLARGVMRCDDQCSPSGCEPLAREICNGEDDDGDGRADNGFDCRFGAREVCEAAAGTDRICSTICTWGPCGKTEICNQVDDDMDGKTDEGFDYAWLHPPFDVPDMSGPGEFAGAGGIADCSDDEVVVITESSVEGEVTPDPGRNVFVHRISLDGRPIHPPVRICPTADNEIAMMGLEGRTRLWGRVIVATCFRAEARTFARGQHRIYFIDENGAILNGPDGDSVEHSVASTCIIGIGSDRLVWALKRGERHNWAMFFRTYDQQGRLLQPEIDTPFQCFEPNLEITADEYGTTLYVGAASEYVPGGAGIWRIYMDLETGVIRGRQELVPGRWSIESVVDGPGRTLIEYNGGVRAVFDDDGRMVGNKIFFGQAPNPLAHQRGRAVGSGFMVWANVATAERISFDGRYGDVASWAGANHDPALDDPFRMSFCVTPQGKHVTAAFAFPEPIRPAPLQRVYVGDCPN